MLFCLRVINNYILSYRKMLENKAMSLFKRFGSIYVYVHSNWEFYNLGNISLWDLWTYSYFQNAVF